MSARIEARRLSGVDLGREVSARSRSRRFGWCGVLVGVEHHEDATHLVFRDCEGVRVSVNVAPSDLVTVTGRGQS